MRKNDTTLLVVVIGAIALFIGYQFKSKEAAVKSAATQIAMNEAANYVKSEAQVTKDYFGSLGNLWKQIWKQ